MMGTGFQGHDHHGVLRDRSIPEGPQAFHFGMGPPKRRCQPSASTTSPCTSTAPTKGLGATWPAPRRASSRQRCIQRSCSMAGPKVGDRRVGRGRRSRYLCAHGHARGRQPHRVRDGPVRPELADLYPQEEVRAIVRRVFHHKLGMDTARLVMERQSALSESELLEVYLPLKRLRRGEPCST